MGYIRSVSVINPRNVIYIKGDADTDGSIRMVGDEQKGDARIEQRIQGNFKSTGLKIGSLSHDNVVTENAGAVITSLSGNLVVKV